LIQYYLYLKIYPVFCSRSTMNILKIFYTEFFILTGLLFMVDYFIEILNFFLFNLCLPILISFKFIRIQNQLHLTLKVCDVPHRQPGGGECG
jgi:hypothetical protein